MLKIKNLYFCLAFLLGLFHLLNVSGLLVFSTMTVRIVHLALILCLGFLALELPLKTRWQLPVRVLAAGLSACCGAYLLLHWESIAISGAISNIDIYVGVAIITLVVFSAWFFVGRALALITLVFLLYPFFCQYLPGVFYSRSFSIERIIKFLVHSGQGVYGIPIGVAATYIILFTIYGAFLSQFGAGDFFLKLARSVTRGMTAASAKAAVLFSALLGMISGSAAGNVAVTGSFTIPMMKKEGYRPHHAAAIEAVVSTGGQIMPPVMGAAAFIMAEIIGIPYLEIMKAAIVPALLFFISIVCVVHLQARKSGIAANDAEQDGGVTTEQPLLKTITEGAPLIIPFVALIAMMLAGYSPFKACFWSIVALLAAQLVFRPKAFVEIAHNAMLATRQGAINAIPISIACAAAGIIAGVLAVSGLGAKLAGFIELLSGGVPLIALVLTAIVAIILGMGLPTTAAYLILATVVAPALANMGVPLLTAHMFVFFFGCISTITPPVALASYVAAGIAKADINTVGWTAFRFGLVCYLLPFMFFFGPALLGQDNAINVVQAFVSGSFGVIAIAASIVGYLKTNLNSGLRMLTFAAGLCLLHQHSLTDVIGAITLTGIYYLQNQLSTPKL